jgi:hypothetical protein
VRKTEVRVGHVWTNPLLLSQTEFALGNSVLVTACGLGARRCMSALVLKSSDTDSFCIRSLWVLLSTWLGWRRLVLVIFDIRVDLDQCSARIRR